MNYITAVREYCNSLRKYKAKGREKPTTSTGQKKSVD
jgi:hypothetical protein